MSGPRIFEAEYYAHLASLETGSWWNAGMRDVATALLRRAVRQPRGRMLDLGCGSGQTMSWFRACFPGWSVAGLDVAREGLAAARSQGEPVCAASALSLPFADAGFDAVLTLDVLQHLPLDGGDGVALREIRRVLRPGGVLLIRTNAQSIPWTPDDPRYDFHKYTRGELLGKLRAAGFQVHRVGRVNAVLGLAEIPRELRATRAEGPGYHGHLGRQPTPGLGWRLKRHWLRVEGALMARGASWPLGRTLMALASVPHEGTVR